MRKSLAIIFLFVSCLASAQANINQYQYVIVPSQFKFTSKVDQYRLNTLTKLLLEKYGFKVYFDSETLPAAIVDSKCDKLYADVTNFGNFITTKMKVSLTDCNNKLMYETAVGTSREKEYRIAYTQALREAIFAV